MNILKVQPHLTNKWKKIVVLTIPRELKKELGPERKPYLVRPMELSHAAGIRSLFCDVYGYSYSKGPVYSSEALIQFLEEKSITSVVAIADGRVVGFMALLKGFGKTLDEIGMAAVRPDFRGNGCHKMMLRAIANKARDMGLTALSSKTVTNHDFAQRSGEDAGVKRCALLLCAVPTTRSYKAIYPALSQRNSLVCGFLPLRTSKEVTIYPPPHHHAFVDHIYNHLGLKRALERPPTSKARAEISVIHTEWCPDCCGTATLTLERPGKDAAKEVERILDGICLMGIEQVTLYLPLEDPFTPAVCEKLEQQGFFIAGVVPLSKMGDALVLQYLNNVTVDYSQIQLSSEFSRYILSYVREHDPACSASHLQTSSL